MQRQKCSSKLWASFCYASLSFLRMAEGDNGRIRQRDRKEDGINSLSRSNTHYLIPQPANDKLRNGSVLRSLVQKQLSLVDQPC